jgi:hypothetical protein
MALWNNTDEAQSAPKHTVNVTNGETGVEAYGKTPVGTFGVDTAEVTSGHAGWNLRTVGEGGRAGRVIFETLVAMGSITGDGDLIPPISGTIEGTGSGTLTSGTFSGTITLNEGTTGTFSGTSLLSVPEYAGPITGTVEVDGEEYTFSGTQQLEIDGSTWVGYTFTATTQSIPGVGVLTITGASTSVNQGTGASTFTGTITN